MRNCALILLMTPSLIVSFFVAAETRAADLREDALNTIRVATSYFANDVAVNGGYVYFYSPDLKNRFGEGVASASQIWVQPPGTPTVGLAFLEAWRPTGDAAHLNAATAAAEALIYGQLQSGAWTNSIDFDTNGQTSLYRNGKGRGRNFSTLDDGTSQAAIQLLMQVDKAHEFSHREIHEAVQVALDALLAAQFANGAFPQGWDETPVAVEHPIVPASYPDYKWRTEGRIKEYWDMYTLNDGAAGTITSTLLMAHDVYGADRYDKALRALGDFLILAQMPQPQPAWAQQYSYAMHPIWARKFEPPAVAGRESQDVIDTLMQIYIATGDDKYLKPVPAALQYLKSSALPDGRLSRYYELQTNRPLYMQRSGKVYSLTYDDSRLPKHYGWKVENRTDELQAEYQRLKKDGAARKPEPEVSDADVQRIVRTLDKTGRWMSRFDGKRLVGQPKFRMDEEYLSSEVFSGTTPALSRWLQQHWRRLPKPAHCSEHRDSCTATSLH